MTSAAERKRRYRAKVALREQAREQGLELLLIPVDVRALEQAIGLPPAPTSEERSEQIATLLELMCLPGPSAYIREELEDIWRRHYAERERCPGWDIGALLSNDENGGAE